MRFMSGPKSSGQVKSESNSHQYLPGEQSKINFAVPSVPVLRNEVQSNTLDCSAPGIIHSNIENMRNISEAEFFK